VSLLDTDASRFVFASLKCGVSDLCWKAPKSRDCVALALYCFFVVGKTLNFICQISDSRLCTKGYFIVAFGNCGDWLQARTIQLTYAKPLQAALLSHNTKRFFSANN
jgi:hypothetical protein